MQRIAMYGTMLALGIAWGCNTSTNPQPTPTPEPKPTPTPTPEPTPGPYVPSERTMRSCEGFSTLEQIEAVYTYIMGLKQDGISMSDAITTATGMCDGNEQCAVCSLAVIDDAYGED